MNEEYQGSRKRLWLTLATVLAVLLMVGGVLIYSHLKTSSPFPKSITQGVSFPLYYPSPLPNDYKLDNSSVKFDSNILFYAISDGGKRISVSEQSAPVNPPDFEAIQKGNTSFKKLEVLGGQAIYGVYQGSPTAILLTNTTLINIYGVRNMPLDVVGKLTQSMNSLGK